MAHFAQLDENNVVVNVIVVADEDTTGGDGVEDESVGIAFLKATFGEDTNWAKTSYNANIRKNYASIGGVFDTDRDAFIPPKPFNSWLLNEDTCTWEAPKPHPLDNEKPVRWDEETKDWVARW
jgi:hypothetical protein